MKYVSDKFLTEPTRFWNIAPETWRMVIDTNVNGPFLMARLAAPVMVRAGWGATLTGMIPEGVPEHIRLQLLDPSIVVPPLLWLASSDSDGITGRRIVATKWPVDRSGRDAAEAAMELAGWP
jgi:3-oxoacyl-[acyl-carrier protein] reductase